MDDYIKMLSQPMLTDEGFINGACLNELAAAIKNMPETFDRLKNHPEWSAKHIVSVTGILAAFALAAVSINGVYGKDAPLAHPTWKRY